MKVFQDMRIFIVNSMFSKSNFVNCNYFFIHLAKRGLPWHLTYVIRVQQSSSSSAATTTSITSSSSATKRLFQHRTFLHMFDQCTQNGRAVTSILADVFKRLKAQGKSLIFYFSLIG